jgi:hypothetical protein
VVLVENGGGQQNDIEENDEADGAQNNPRGHFVPFASGVANHDYVPEEFE